MTQGAVIFAYDSRIRYTHIARESSRRLKKHLGIPVTLITDVQGLDDDWFDDIIYVPRPHGEKRYWSDRDRTAIWYNANRASAWDLSPYDRTLLIDADCWLASDRLGLILDGPQHFACHRSAVNLPAPGQIEIKKFGKKAVDMWWATVVIFDRSRYSQDIFDCWKMIEQHYQHYADMFAFSSSQFRNDFALSLSLLLVSGHVMPRDAEIPWPLINIQPEAIVTEIDQGHEIAWVKGGSSNRSGRIIIDKQDLHFMCKQYLEDFVDRNATLA